MRGQREWYLHYGLNGNFSSGQSLGLYLSFVRIENFLLLSKFYSVSLVHLSFFYDVAIVPTILRHSSFSCWGLSEAGSTDESSSCNI